MIESQTEWIDSLFHINIRNKYKHDDDDNIKVIFIINKYSNFMS